MMHELQSTHKNVKSQHGIIKHENFTWHIVTSTWWHGRTTIAGHFFGLIHFIQ